MFVTETQKLGVNIAMLTGDHSSVAEKVSLFICVFKRYVFVVLYFKLISMTNRLLEILKFPKSAVCQDYCLLRNWNGLIPDKTLVQMWQWLVMASMMQLLFQVCNNFKKDDDVFVMHF